MLTVHTWTTPNGRKPLIMLEELGVEYRIAPVDIHADEQFKPAFLAISPNNKIPALVDDEAECGSLALFESGAILIYLAEKYGRFLAPSGPARYQAMAWLEWQIGGLGPMLGQVGYFALFAKEKSAVASERFIKESTRLLAVMEKRLAESPYLGGAEYSIADMAAYPWVAAAREKMSEVLGEALTGQKALQAWMAKLEQRPAVQRGMALPKV